MEILKLILTLIYLFSTFNLFFRLPHLKVRGSG